MTTVSFRLVLLLALNRLREGEVRRREGDGEGGEEGEKREEEGEEEEAVF